jgi:hypothetical protein
MSTFAEQAPVRLGPRLPVGSALRKAARAFYENSFRLIILNTLFSGVALAILALALYQPAALILLLALGPLAAALMHCAVTVVQEDDVRLGDVLAGIRLHWRRGLLLGVLAAAAVLLTAIAVGFYSTQSALSWPLAVLTLYVTGLFGIYQLSLWPLAVLERDRPLRAVLRDAGFALLRRPRGFTGLAIALLVINLIGLVAAVLPLLTMTISYSFLAAAFFALPRVSEEG